MKSPDEKIAEALHEGIESYNKAKKNDEDVQISTSSFFVLFAGYCAMAKIPLYNADTKEQLVNPRAEEFDKLFNKGVSEA